MNWWISGFLLEIIKKNKNAAALGCLQLLYIYIFQLSPWKNGARAKHWRCGDPQVSAILGTKASPIVGFSAKKVRKFKASVLRSILWSMCFVHICTIEVTIAGSHTPWYRFPPLPPLWGVKEAALASVALDTSSGEQSRNMTETRQIWIGVSQFAKCVLKLTQRENSFPLCGDICPIYYKPLFAMMRCFSKSDILTASLIGHMMPRLPYGWHVNHGLPQSPHQVWQLSDTLTNPMINWVFLKTDTKRDHKFDPVQSRINQFRFFSISFSLLLSDVDCILWYFVHSVVFFYGLVV